MRIKVGSNQCLGVENGIEKKKDLMKSKKKVNWWNTEKATVNYKSTLFVTPTPGGVMAKEVERR